MAGVVKVILNDDTLIDITDTTTGAGKTLRGYLGYGVDGEPFFGTQVLARATVSGDTLTLTDGFPVEV